MTVRPEAVWQALAGVMDPELPIVSVVAMGMIRAVEIEGERVTVALTPPLPGARPWQ